MKLLFTKRAEVQKSRENNRRGGIRTNSWPLRQQHEAQLLPFTQDLLYTKYWAKCFIWIMNLHEKSTG